MESKMLRIMSAVIIGATIVFILTGITLLVTLAVYFLNGGDVVQDLGEGVKKFREAAGL